MTVSGHPPAAIAASAARETGLPGTLAERDALLAAVIEGSSASVSIADARSDALPLIYVNPAFLALSGYRRDEVIGANCRFLTAEPAASPERTRLRETVAARGSGTFELRNRRATGEIFWNRLTIYPVLGQDGRPEFLVGTQVEITAERNAAEQRDVARRRLIGALSSTSEGFLMVEPSGRVAFANRRYRDFFETASGIFDEGADFVAAWAARLADLGTPRPNATRLARARQDALFAGGRDREERLPDGRILLVNDRPTADGGAVSIATDITSLKAAERLTAHRAAAIDAAQDAIALTDEGGRFVYMNPSHLALFGFSREAEVLGRPWSILYDSPEVAYLEEVAMPLLGATGMWRGEIVGRRRDGAPVPQEVSLTMLPGVGLICVTRDTSERLRTERERERLEAQIQAAQRREAIGQLAAGFAHDFNNLLTAIAGSVALIEPDLPAGTDAHAHLARIAAAHDRASDLVARMLDHGSPSGAVRRIDLRGPFDEALELLRAGHPARIGLEVERPHGPLGADADATAFVQVILNLAINARDAMPTGPGRLTLSLRGEIPDDRPRKGPGVVAIGTLRAGRRHGVLTVADTGGGIPAAALGKIFEPYFSTKGPRGTGLGLSVVASIVQAAQGAIAVASTPGVGTRFRVYWPLAGEGPPGEGPAAPLSPSASREEHDGPGLEGRTILICEDDEAVGEVVARILERAGAEAAVCHHPRDALSAIAEDPTGWDLLVTDFDLPGFRGDDLARRARLAAPDLPILLCTALPNHERTSGAFDAVLAKPVVPARLLALCRHAIMARRGSGDG